LGPFGRSETTEFTPGPILSEVTVEWALKRVEERAAGTLQELFHSANNEENQKVLLRKRGFSKGQGSATTLGINRATKSLEVRTSGRFSYGRWVTYPFIHPRAPSQSVMD